MSPITAKTLRVPEAIRRFSPSASLAFELSVHVLTDTEEVEVPLSETELNLWRTTLKIMAADTSSVSIRNQLRRFLKVLEHASKPSPCKTVVPPALDMEALQTQIKLNVMNEVNSKFQKLNDRIDELEESITGLYKGFERIDTAVKRLEVVCESSTNEAPVDSSAGSQKDRFVVLPKCTIEDITSSTADVSSGNSVILRRVEQLAEKMQILAPTVVRLDAKVDRLDIKIDRTDIKVGSLSDTTDNHEKRIDRNAKLSYLLQRKTDLLDETLEQVEQKGNQDTETVERLSELKATIDGVRSAMVAKSSVASVERLERRSKSFIDETHIRTMNRALLLNGQWAHPVPSLDGLQSPQGLEAFPKGEWPSHLPHTTKGLIVEDLTQ
ncbi:hypothetical protein IAU59_005222 [Kwoniella sp. CBS 9459]